MPSYILDLHLCLQTLSWLAELIGFKSNDSLRIDYLTFKSVAFSWIVNCNLPWVVWRNSLFILIDSDNHYSIRLWAFPIVSGTINVISLLVFSIYYCLDYRLQQLLLLKHKYWQISTVFIFILYIRFKKQIKVLGGECLALW